MEKFLYKRINELLGTNYDSNKHINWWYISKFQKLSEEFIREFQDKVNWIDISVHQKLSEDFIREFQDKVHWSNISSFQKLSEDFIREFQDEVAWDYISWKQNLSEDFIREFQDNVDWEYISAYQKLSEDFIREFKNKLYLNEVLFKRNREISNELIDDIFFDITKKMAYDDKITIIEMFSNVLNKNNDKD